MSFPINNLSRVGNISNSLSISGVAPNWTNIPTKGASNLSYDEIKVQVKELGEQFSKATSEKEREQIARKSERLFTMCMSIVAPDRKALYENAVKEIKKQGGIGKKEREEPTPQKTLIDYLNMRDGLGEYRNGKGMKFDKAYHFAGGGSVTAGEVTGGGAIFDVALNGESVLSIHAGCLLGNGVYFTPTVAEQAITKEIGNIWYNAKGGSSWLEANRTNIATDGGIDIKA